MLPSQPNPLVPQVAAVQRCPEDVLHLTGPDLEPPAALPSTLESSPELVPKFRNS